MIQAILLGLGLGGILGLVLGIANKEFEVPEDPRLAKLLEMLPGYNCGACGYPGCSGLAGSLRRAQPEKTAAISRIAARRSVMVFFMR